MKTWVQKPAMTTSRRATSMTLDAALLDEARALGVNLSRAAEEGILAQVRAARAKRWKEDNAADIAAYNRWIDENGVPLAQFRKF
jgi:antitoxin CcdA